MVSLKIANRLAVLIDVNRSFVLMNCYPPWISEDVLCCNYENSPWSWISQEFWWLVSAHEFATRSGIKKGFGTK